MKHFKIKFGLRGRITLFSSGIIVIAFFLIAFYLVNNTQHTYIKNLNESSKAFASLATQPIGSTYGIYQYSGTLRITQQIQSLTDLDNNISNVGVIDLSDNIIYSQHAQPRFQTVNAGDSFNTIYTDSSKGLISQIVVPYIADDGQHPYSIAYTISSNAVNHDINNQITEIFIFGVISLIVCAGALYELLSRFFIGPIERVSSQALIISQGKYDQTVNVVRQDEIGYLANSVNTMSEHLQADIAKLQEVDSLKNEFITITSHNLRTPLSIIRGNIDLLDSASLAPNIAKIIHSINISASQLGAFAEDMLTIASIEANNKAITPQDTTIADLVTANLQETFNSMAKQKNINLNWHIHDPAAVVSVSPSHIQSVIRNLVDNAVKFTNEGGSVDFKIAIQNAALVITVHDTGIGISDDEQTKLFTKFHRGTNIMQYDYAGTGIGLYVTKLIVEAQHGSIQVESELGKGATFTVIIPQTASRKQEVASTSDQPPSESSADNKTSQ
ncbi:MAG: HAMP domain-containing sensor histidine kinase [Candidatus Saccharimonadales bacterium]